MPRRRVLVLALVTLAAVPATSVSAVGEAPAKQGTKLAKLVRLKAFGSCKGLIRYGRRHSKAGAGGAPVPVEALPEPLLGDQPPLPVPAPAPAPQTREGTAEAAPDDSGTNVQEDGVDEPDLVKAGGGRIFVVAGEQLHAVGSDRLELLGSLKLDGSGHQLLLHGDRLLVISHSGELGSGQEPVVDAPTPRIAPGWDDAVTQLTEVDVSSPAAMRVVRTERIRGNHVSSRLTGPTARVVVWTRPGAIDEPRFRTQLRGWLPRRVLRRAVGGRPRFRLAARCRRVFRPVQHSGLDVLTVLTIDMAKGLPAIDSDAVMGSGQTIYASRKALYVATSKFVAEGDADGVPAGERTQLHKFDASDPHATSYRASGQVEGHLTGQFALSEHEGVLRAATTVGFGSASDSRVVTFGERDGVLARLGQVTGLGQGERIYAVRFLGDAGYVVTFREVDPLYTLDLSAPPNPRAVGELKIQGYSAYLHPVADGLLLGVGQDATERGATLGTQVSLFDVSDPAHPRRLHQRALTAGSSSEAELDHHAFLWWAPSKLAVLPLESWGSERSFAGAVGLTVEAATGIAEVGRAAHVKDGARWRVRRSLVVDGRLLTISDVGIERNSLASLAEEAWLAFP